jgi:putative ABC transport system permease protein
MSFSRDLRFAARRLTAAPGYTIAAVATLALAIGASTAIFSAVYAVLLKPMPIHEPGQLALGWGFSAAQNIRQVELSYLDIRDLADATPPVGRVAAVGSSAWNTVLDGEGEPIRLPAFGVSGRLFEVLGAAPFLGRVIGPDDDIFGAAPVVVLSHATWRQQFGGDPSAIGRRIRLDGELAEVIGVMPAGFDYPRGAALWVPVVPVFRGASEAARTAALRNVGVLFMVARLNPGITSAMAAEEWTRANAALQVASQFPKYTIVVTPFLDFQIGPAKQAMWPLFAAVGVLLLIACANVSGLMLTRVSMRNHDDAIRLAIGGSRGAISRLWLAETVWLIAAGGALGLLTCQWFISAIVALAPEGIPRLDEVAMDVPVLLFSVSVMALATLLCAAAPIRHAGVVNLADTLNDGSRTIAGGRSYRTRSSLLVVQIGLAVVLLVAAGLVVRSFAALQDINLGFDRRSVVTLKVNPRVDAQPDNLWVRALLPHVAALPEVESAGAVYLTPMELGSIGQGLLVTLDGQRPDAARQNPLLNYQVATPDYFRTMRIPLIRGRHFTDDDRAGSPRVAIISESMAAALFPGQDPIGKRFNAASFSIDATGEGEPNAWRTVVGVVGNVRYRGLEEIQLDIYDPAMQTRMGATSLVVRLKPEHADRALGVAAAIEALARQMDPRVIVAGITTLDAVVDEAMAPWRFSAWVFGLFAVLAFALSMLGLFSLVSLDVANRRQEFAIRMAIGATGRDIVSGVCKSAGARAGLGIAIGVAAAFVATRSLRDLLYGVELTDWRTYTTVIALVLIVVSIAAYLPARRAAAAAPLALLRRP